MFNSQFLRPRYFVLLVLLVIIGASMYAFAAANTVEESSAGIGEAAISGYDVTDVAYTLAADPTYLASVAFSTDSAATTVKVQPDPSGTWFDCDDGASSGLAWTCDISTTQTVSATMLNVAAVQ